MPGGMGDMWGSIIQGISEDWNNNKNLVNSAYFANMNEKEAEHMTRWAYGREDTAMQRRVADLIKAGLSPMLAYGGMGSAQSSMGSAVQAHAPQGRGGIDAQAINSGMLLKQQLANMQSQQKLIDEQARTQGAEADKAQVEKSIYRAVAPLAEALTRQLGTWSAESARKVPGTDAGSILDAARGKTTDMMEWISDTVRGLSDKGTWLRFGRDAQESLNKEGK